MASSVDNFSRRLKAGEDGGRGVWPLLPPVAGCVPGAIPFPPRLQLLGAPRPRGASAVLTHGLCALPLPPGASGLLILGAPSPLLISFLHMESAQKIGEEKEQPPPRPAPRKNATLWVEFYFLLGPKPYNLLCARNCNSWEYREYNIKTPTLCHHSFIGKTTIKIYK